jgi:hypothetical protein
LPTDGNGFRLTQTAKVLALFSESTPIELMPFFLRTIGKVEPELVSLSVVIKVKAITIVIPMIMEFGPEDDLKHFTGLLGAYFRAILNVTPDIESNGDESQQDPDPRLPRTTTHALAFSRAA